MLHTFLVTVKMVKIGIHYRVQTDNLPWQYRATRFAR